MTVSMFPLMAEGLAWKAIKKTKSSSSTSTCSSLSSSGKKSKKRSLQLTPTVTVIQDYVERIVKASPLLNKASNPEIVNCGRSALSVGRTVGEGSFSQVCAVRRKGRTNKNQVIKQLHPKLFSLACTAAPPEDVQAAQRTLDHAAADLMMEALYLSSLQHPNIVSVSVLSNNSADFFMCIEHLPATLDSKLTAWRAQKNLNRTAILPVQIKYAAQLSSALAYLHSQRIVLRDLKPDNVGITSDDSIKLFDFGLCRELPPLAQAVKDKVGVGRSSSRTSLTDLSMSTCHSSEFHIVPPTSIEDTATYHMTQVGTIRYCAGEILLGQPYNAKCDVYSFAVVLYELVTLQTAFPNIDMQSEDSQQEHLAKVCVGGKRPGLSLYQLPSSVERIIRKSWQRNPLKRWNSAQMHQAMVHAQDEVQRIPL